jgi:predicted transcriptional regulator
MTDDIKDHPMISRLEVEIEILERHVEMLRQIQAHQPIGIIKLAEELGYPQHKVRYSLRILEQEKLIHPSTHGATVTSKVPGFQKRLITFLESMKKSIDNIEKSLATPKK